MREGMMHIARAANEEGQQVTVMTCPTCYSTAVRETAILMKAHGVTVRFSCVNCATQFAVDYLAVRATWVQRSQEKMLAMQVFKHWCA
jgi:transposase-like protein